MSPVSAPDKAQNVKRRRLLAARSTPQQRVALAAQLVRDMRRTTSVADLAAATGIAPSGINRLAKGEGTRVSWRSLDAITRAHTQAQWSTHAAVPADLTRRRIRSMSALGYTLAWQSEQTGLGLLRGRWQHSPNVRVFFAQAVLDLYQRVGDTPSPQPPEARVQALAYARRHDAQIPAAWDDPGTLAWPDGGEQAPPPVDTIDEIAWLVDAGETIPGITRRLGIERESLRRFLHRHDRRDLLDRLWKREVA